MEMCPGKCSLATRECTRLPWYLLSTWSPILLIDWKYAWGIKSWCGFSKPQLKGFTAAYLKCVWLRLFIFFSEDRNVLWWVSNFLWKFGSRGYLEGVRKDIKWPRHILKYLKRPFPRPSGLSPLFPQGYIPTCGGLSKPLSTDGPCLTPLSGMLCLPLTFIPEHIDEYFHWHSW